MRSAWALSFALFACSYATWVCWLLAVAAMRTFAVSAAFVFGDHLGFTAGFAPEMIGPMIVGKLVGGVSAIAVAMWLTGKEEKS